MAKERINFPSQRCSREYRLFNDFQASKKVEGDY